MVDAQRHVRFIDIADNALGAHALALVVTSLAGAASITGCDVSGNAACRTAGDVGALSKALRRLLCHPPLLHVAFTMPTHVGGEDGADSGEGAHHTARHASRSPPAAGRAAGGRARSPRGRARGGTRHHAAPTDRESEEAITSAIAVRAAHHRRASPITCTCGYHPFAYLRLLLGSVLHCPWRPLKSYIVPRTGVFTTYT